MKVSIGVEAFMTNPPKPGGITVMVDGRSVATFTYEEVKAVVEQFAAMKEIHDTFRAKHVGK